jgi:aminoglycoside/choline kinase family phosphotransferase
LDKRLAALTHWLGRVLSRREFAVHPIAGDAGFRRYFRVVAAGDSYIAVDLPPEQGDTRPFVEIARRFHTLGLHVPRILEQDLSRGFLLISDLGERLYLPHLNEHTVERLYGDALGALIVLQAGTFAEGPASGGTAAADTGADRFLPDYDEALLNRELELFREWYLGRHRGLRLTPPHRRVLDRTFEFLTRSALEQPRVWVHRDFHARNLLVTDVNNPGILDFQDAVLGPVSYDLVSLLRDCYISWPRERVEDWAKGYHELARQSGIPVGADDGRFLRWFDLMGVQRHLKATGIFARLRHRDGKPGYLGEIPRTLGYVWEVSARYPELEAFHRLLQEIELPGAA